MISNLTLGTRNLLNRSKRAQRKPRKLQKSLKLSLPLANTPISPPTLRESAITAHTKRLAARHKSFANTPTRNPSAEVSV